VAAQENDTVQVGVAGAGCTNKRGHGDKWYRGDNLRVEKGGQIRQNLGASKRKRVHTTCGGEKSALAISRQCNCTRVKNAWDVGGGGGGGGGGHSKKIKVERGGIL